MGAEADMFTGCRRLLKLKVVCNPGEAVALATYETGESIAGIVSRTGHIIDVVARIHSRKHAPGGIGSVSYDRSAGVCQALQRSVEIVSVAHALAYTRNGPLLARQAAQHIVAIAGRTRLIGQAAQVTDTVRPLIIDITDTAEPGAIGQESAP